MDYGSDVECECPDVAYYDDDFSGDDDDDGVDDHDVVEFGVGDDGVDNDHDGDYDDAVLHLQDLVRAEVFRRLNQWGPISAVATPGHSKL